MRTFTFSDIAAYKSAKASGGSIYAALIGDNTLKSGAVVSKITSTGDVLIDAMNPFVTPNLATNGDTLYYSSTEGYRSLRKGKTTWDANSLGQVYIDTSRLPNGFAVVSAQNDVFTFKSMQGETTGSGRSKMVSVRGNSLAWNQLIQNGDFSGTTGWSLKGSNGEGSTFSVSNNVCTVTMGVGATASARIGHNAPNIYGHKYYARFLVNPSSATTCAVYYNSAYTPKIRVDANKLTLVSAIINATNEAVNGVDFAYNRNTELSNGNTVQIRNCCLVDLTLLYGAAIDGLTDAQILAKFEAEYPLSYYDYNAGELLDNKVQGLEVVGFNQWDEEWETGVYTGSGVKRNESSDNNRIRCKNYIPILPGTTYYRNLANTFLRFYDANKQFISTNDTAVVGEFTTPANACFLTFCMAATYGNTYLHDICINLSDTARNGQYEPYKKTIVPFDVTKIRGHKVGTITSEVIFPNGMKSAGSVYDEIDLVIGKAYRRVGSVDMGTLSWSSNETIWNASFNSAKKPSSNTDVANLLSEKYKTRASTGTGSDPYGIALNTSGNLVANTNSSTVSPTGLLNYELAAYEEFELDYPLTPIIYPADGGTKQMLPVNGSAPVTAPMSAMVLPI